MDILAVEEGEVFALGQAGAPLKPGLCSSYLPPLVSDKFADFQCINQLGGKTNFKWDCAR